MTMEEILTSGLSDAVLLSETSVVLSTLLRSNLRDVRFCFKFLP